LLSVMTNCSVSEALFVTLQSYTAEHPGRYQATTCIQNRASTSRSRAVRHGQAGCSVPVHRPDAAGMAGTTAETIAKHSGLYHAIRTLTWA
jgi:hypothetical protein